MLLSVTLGGVLLFLLVLICRCLKASCTSMGNWE